ncbi:MAG: FAD-dependent oxidoreductase [Chloroflexi bacterium]|nr:FAD-dependent oxidoreductase [Chloroflexota bacterium]
MSPLGTPENPLVVAVVGSGPSGFYAAEHLFKQLGSGVRVVMIERLPTPFGLVRGGVAPDHQKIKSVTKVYDKIAQREGFSFLGNVEFGTTLPLDMLRQFAHAVIFATGAQTDRSLGIEGEDLPGSYAATDFVAWYNGHPDYRHLSFDLTAERAIVVGIGNVAMDVARILGRTCAELSQTDIADYALDALDQSRVKEIIVIGRRGPAQAAFTPPELKELSEMPDTDLIIAPEDAVLDPLSEAWLKTSGDRDAAKNVALLQEYSQRAPQGKSRRIVMRFLTSPLAIHGGGKVEAVTLGRNQLVERDHGYLSAEPTGETEIVSAGLVFRSVGYRGVALPGVPFDAKRGVIPNSAGRVLNAPGGEPVPGLYAVGWIKRGPSGIIGTNKPDSIATVDSLLADLQTGALGETPAGGDLESVLRAAGVRVVSYGDWQRLDTLETHAGERLGRPRVKLTDVAQMLAALDE